MKKSDIRNGMHVITKEGEEYIVISNVCAPKQMETSNTAEVIMLNLNGGWMNFDKYDDDLCFCDTDDEYDYHVYDINEVYAPNFYGLALESVLESKNKNDFIRLWKRGAQIKKMTKAEIEAKLGYEIEIVENED